VTRYGGQYGPDVTFVGVNRCDLAEPVTYADADVVVLGAPFDGGTSHRPGARFGPQAIRTTDYLAHDGSRPSLALRTDGLRDLRVLDAGDVEMPPGDIIEALRRLEVAVEAVSRSGAIPVVLGGDHSIAYADAKGVAGVVGHGQVSMLPFDAHADTGTSSSARYGDTGNRCAGSSSPGRCAGTGSFKSACGATGRPPRHWTGWPDRACVPMR